MRFVASAMIDSTRILFTLTISWGDGSANTIQALAAGTRNFTATHQYLDDKPTGTPSDVYTIAVTVQDDDSGSGSANTLITVNNVAPLVNAGADATINEGGTFNSTGAFADPGTLDTWTATVNYGDGSGTAHREGVVRCA